MADIIDFRAKSKSYRKLNRATIKADESCQIILFSGVRIERDEMPNKKSKLNKSVSFLTSKSS